MREQVDRAVRRVAVEVPADCPLRADDVAWAFAGLSPLVEEHDPTTGERHAPLLVTAEDRAMLDRYCPAARVWRSETPLALPARRRGIDPAGPNRKPGGERLTEDGRAAAAVMAALRHAGVLARPASIRVQRDPFAARGTRAEAFAAGSRFSGPTLWHVELGFHEPVAGPLILGDGRFCGLGLMAPAATRHAVFAFAIASGLDGGGPEEIACALRRAVMARVRDARGSADLPPFFSGHLPDGGPVRDDAHPHLAFVADLASRRLLVIPPHVVGHRDPDRRENELENLSLLERALAGFSELRAGRAGRLGLAPIAVGDDDPLLAPAQVWESATPYRPTHHPKRDAEAGVAEDIRHEAVRRNLPRPEVAVIGIKRGPHGGLAVRARIVFARAIPGPVLLGRTMHRGGGLFLGVRDSG